MTAYCSEGYLQADEHYQIIESAQYFLQKTSVVNLPWEFHEKIRSTFLPAIAALVISISNHLGIESPFQIAFILRLLTGALVFRILYVWTNKFSNSKKYLAILLALLLCFIPYLGVRFSSETWSGLFLFWAWLSFEKNSSQRQLLYVGALIGIAFLCRFQILILVAIWLLHLVFIHKMALPKILSFVCGFITIVLLGIILDAYLYHEWTISAWNYSMSFFYPQNPSAFSANSWDFYLQFFIPKHAFILPEIILIATLFYIGKHPKNILSWWIIAFVTFHQIVPHKEFRFLIPLVFFLPEVLSHFFTFLKEKCNPRIYAFLAVVLMGINVYAIPFFCLRPAGLGRISSIHWLYDQHFEKPLKITCTCFSNPLNPWGGHGNSFYNVLQANFTEIANVGTLQHCIAKDSVEILIIRNAEWKDKIIQEQLISHGFSPIYFSVPKWVMSGNRHLNWLDNNQALVLLQHK